MRSSQIRVIIADDHPIIADGIQLRLETSLMVQIVGVARSFAEALAHLQDTPADVLVLDLAGMQGPPIATVRHIRRTHPDVAIVIFSSLLSLAPELPAAGVSGYVAKEDLASHLSHAIQSACAGRRYLSPAVEQHLEHHQLDLQPQHLTPRSRVCLSCSTRGWGRSRSPSNWGSTRSVQNYIMALNRKVGVTSRHLLVERYRRSLKRAAE